MSEFTLPALPPGRADYKERLEAILPRAITGTTDSCNDIAAAAAFVLMYVGAVAGQRLARPSMVTQMDSQAATHRTDEERLAWHRAAGRGRKAIDALTRSWGVTDRQPWYADNSREGIRDETFRTWSANGALTVDEAISTTSSRSRYSFAAEFSALLDPALQGTDLAHAIAAWQRGHLTATGRLRARRHRQTGRSASAVTVQLPDGGTRDLLAGPSSEILKGVIEDFARFLDEPVVVFISQSGDKVNVVDQDLLDELGLSVDQQRLLPDALVADLGPAREEFWFVEVVATDGPVSETRKAQFLDWALANRIEPASCRFLTAFPSRTSSQARKALPVLARGTCAWFNDEPDGLLTWGDLRPDAASDAGSR